MSKKIRISPLLLFFIGIIIAIPALWINLGDQPLIDDEAIRALVAFEMLEKGDIITPTIAGEYYLKKPPLYNWLIIISFKALNRYDELAVRMPMILSLLVFAFVIFYYFRKEMNTHFAVFVSLMFLTSGRVLFYESLFGLIDISYSLLIFIFFMHVYRSFIRGKLVQLFLFGYILISLSFLMKGLPSIAFLGITLLVLFISQKKFRLLFHWAHYLGILVFLVVVGSYYLLYFHRNDIPLQEMLDVVLGESTRRTVVKFGFWNTILHIIAYPFEVLFHFMPWGILAILLLKKGSFSKIKSHPFLRYISLVFVANIIIYWTSPEVFPRYILMLVPLLFGVFVFVYLEQQKDRTIHLKIAELIFGIIVSLSVLIGIVPFFLEPAFQTPQLFIWTALLSVSIALLVFVYWKEKANRLLLLAIVLLLTRIGFDLIVIPDRIANSAETEGKHLALDVVEASKGQALKFYWNPDIEKDIYYGNRITTYRFNYYIFLYRNEVVPLSFDKEENTLYITKLGFLKEEKVEILKQFRPPGQPSDLVLIRFLPE